MTRTCKAFLLLVLLTPLLANAGDINQELLEAARKGDATAVKALLTKGADANTRDNEVDGSALIWATAGRHRDVVGVLLKAGADVNAKDKDGVTALMLAAQRGETEIVKMLVAEDADVNAKNKDGVSALMLAAQRDNREIVEMLVAEDADVNAKRNDGMTALLLAVGNFHTDTVKVLLRRGADPNVRLPPEGWTALMSAANLGRADIAEALLAHAVDVNAKNNDGMTALMLAAETGHTDILTLLLANGADLNIKHSNGMTALMWATARVQVEAARMLREAGAVWGSAEDTELIEAATNGEAEKVQALLKAGADPNAIDGYYISALMRAAGEGHTGAVKALLDGGANVNMTSLWLGQTALMAAADGGHAEVVKTLLLAGADVNATAEDGRTALMFAKSKGHTSVVELLKKASAEAVAGHDELNGGIEAFRNGEFELAVPLLRHAKELDPERLDVRIYLGIAYAQQMVPQGTQSKEMREKALAEFQQVLEMDQQNPLALEWVGALLFWEFVMNPDDATKIDESKSFFRRLIQVQPQYPEPHYWIGVLDWTLAYRARMKTTTTYNAQADKMMGSGEPLPDVLREELASQYSAVVDEGIQHLQEAIELVPDYWEAIMYLNLLYREKAHQVASAAERERYLSMADALYEQHAKERNVHPDEHPFRPIAPPLPPPPPE